MGFRIRVQYVGWFGSWRPYGRVDEPGYHSYGWFHVLMDGEVELVLDIKKDVGIRLSAITCQRFSMRIPGTFSS